MASTRDSLGNKTPPTEVWLGCKAADFRTTAAYDGGPYETKAEALHRYPREHEVALGEEFVISRAFLYVPRPIVGWDVMQDASDQCVDECGKAAAEWLQGEVEAEDVEDLENRLNGVFCDWLAEKGLDAPFYEEDVESREVFRFNGARD